MVSRGRRLDLESVESSSSATVFSAAKLDDAARHEFRKGRQCHVLGHAEGATSPSTLRSAGNKANALGRCIIGGTRNARRLPSTIRCRRQAAVCPARQRARSSRPEPMTPAMPSTSPSWSAKLTLGKAPCLLKILAFKHDFCRGRGLARLAVIFMMQLAAHHVLVQFLDGRILCGQVPRQPCRPA